MRENNRESSTLGNMERTLSVLGGSLLLYNSFSGGKKSIAKTMAAGYLVYRGVSGNCPVSNALQEGSADPAGRSIRIKTGLTVSRPRNEVYAFWRKLENLPLFMNHLESVTALDDRISEWKAIVPGGMATISWKSEITQEEPDELISWRSLPGSTVKNSGSVRFHEAGKYGTRILADISYQAPLGTPGEAVLKMLNPGFEYLVKSDIRNFKKFMETGEVATVDGQSSGRLALE